MQRLVPRNTTRRPTRLVERQTTVCVVDPNIDDYPAWREFAKAGQVRLTLLTRPEQALRFSRANAIDLWIINTRLPGLSGFELCSMLRSRSSSRTSICLVADEYSAEAERAAWAARATLFGCKAGHLELLDYWLATWSAEPLHGPRSVSRPELPLND